MRRAINENPLVQIGLLAVLALAVGMLLLTRMGGSGSDSADTSIATPAGATASSAAAPTLPAPTAATPTAPSSTPATPAGPATPQSAAALGFVAGPGLPKPVVDAYDAGDTVVLMIYRLKGIDDPFVFQSKQLIEALPPSSGIEGSVFLVPAQNIARYSRITEGVNVDRVPAIVVIKPKDLTDGVPTASVSYGVRGPASVVQIVKDAVYAGRELPYYPTK